MNSSSVTMTKARWPFSSAAKLLAGLALGLALLLIPGSLSKAEEYEPHCFQCYIRFQGNNLGHEDSHAPWSNTNHGIEHVGWQNSLCAIPDHKDYTQQAP